MSGLDAPYYDFPHTVRTAQDLIEWLEEGGMRWSCSNILKSIIREYNPDEKKKTNPLYEAEKRYYFAKRHLDYVRRLQEGRTTGS